jgi:hypothetical protein
MQRTEEAEIPMAKSRDATLVDFNGTVKATVLVVKGTFTYS